MECGPLRSRGGWELVAHPFIVRWLAAHRRAMTGELNVRFCDISTKNGQSGYDPKSVAISALILALFPAVLERSRVGQVIDVGLNISAPNCPISSLLQDQHPGALQRAAAGQ